MLSACDRAPAIEQILCRLLWGPVTSYILSLLNMLLCDGEGAISLKPFYINQSGYLGVMCLKCVVLF